MNDDLRAKLAAPMDYQYRPGTTTNKRENGRYPPGTKAMMLAFIDARDIMNRLDDAVGLGKWQSQIKQVNPDGSVVVSLGLFIETDDPQYVHTPQWVWQEDVGYRNDPDSDKESEPLKAAASDGLKRAAVKFGVGRFLYDLPSSWAEIDAYGKPLKQPGSTRVEGLRERQLGQPVGQPTLAQQVQRSIGVAERSAAAREEFAKQRDNKGEQADMPCEVPGCELVCAGKFVGYSQRTYGLTLCGKHSKHAKDGALDLDAVKYEIATGVHVDHHRRNPAQSDDVAPGGDESLDADTRSFRDWSDFWGFWKTKGLHNSQDIARRTHVPDVNLATMQPDEVHALLLKAGA